MFNGTPKINVKKCLDQVQKNWRMKKKVLEN